MKYSQLMRNVKRDHSNHSPSLILVSEIMGFIILFMSCTMIVLTCAPSIRMELSGQAKTITPTMEILGVSVSGLNVTDTKVSAKWDVILAIQNPNLISTLYFDHVEGMVLYKDEVLVVSSLMKPFVLGPREHRIVNFRLRRNGWGIDGDQPMVKGWIVKMIKKEKEGEKIKFSVEMGVWAKIKCGWLWTKRVIMNPRCNDLSIDLVPKRGFGILLDDEPKQCYVPMLDD